MGQLVLTSGRSYRHSFLPVCLLIQVESMPQRGLDRFLRSFAALRSAELAKERKPSSGEQLAHRAFGLGELFGTQC